MILYWEDLKKTKEEIQTFCNEASGLTTFCKYYKESFCEKKCYYAKEMKRRENGRKNN